MLNVLYYGGVPNAHQWRWNWTGSVTVGHYLPRVLRKRVQVTYYPLFAMNRTYLMDLLQAHAKFISGQFDIIHLNRDVVWMNGSRILLPLAKIRNARVILNIHHSIPPHTLSCSKSIDRIIVNSNYMRCRVSDWYGINPEKIVVIPNGVDVSRFRECFDRAKLDGDPVVLYLGGTSWIKGADIMMRAIHFVRSQLPHIGLHILGPGSVNEFHLLAKKEAIEKHVFFHGQVANSMVPRYYKAADICVVPSRTEALGIVVLEAMASGVPVIGSNVGGIPEIISNYEDGVLFKAGDAGDLSRTIVDLSRDSALRRKISQTASRKVTEFDWDNVAERYVSLYASLQE